MRFVHQRIIGRPVRSRSLPLLVLLLAIVFSATGTNALAQQVRFALDFNQSDFAFDKYGDYDIVKLRGGMYLSDDGKPWIPAKEVRIALPDGMKAENVIVESVRNREIAGEFSIFPSQPPLKFGMDTDEPEFVMPNQAIYSSSEVYPSLIAELIGQADLAGQSFAIVRVYPMQYIPSLGKLILNESVEISISGTAGYVCGDYLPDNISDAGKMKYENMLSVMLSNPEEASVAHSPLRMTKSAALPPGGPFDHVIITNSAEASYWEPLVEWHNKKGVRDTVITNTYIYGNYSGANNQERVRNFVIDAHDNWGTMYFLIGGEHGDIPFKFRTYESESIPSDQYYADYDDDWQLEVFVGRVTADNSSQISRFIDKLMKYETDPEFDDYLLDVTLLGMDLTTEFDPPYYQQTPTEDMKEYIFDEYIPSIFNVTKVYDSYGGNHKTDFINALNDGQHLVNHSDHSYYNVMCTGDRNHGWCMYSSEVDYLTNTDRMSIIVSLGCHANEMDYNDCISEHFVIYNDMKAGVAFTGNTRSGWFYVGDPMSLSSSLDIQWWKGLFDQNNYRLGETIAYAKNNNPSGGIWNYCQWTLNLLGEPEMPVWTELPDSFVVTHPTYLPVGSSMFTVHVEEFGPSNIEGAYVCLWKEGEVYATGYTDASGNVTLTATPESVGYMDVTITMQNFIPYRGTAEVTLNNLPPECQVPEETSVFICETQQVCLPVGCYDPDGNLASGPTITEGPGEIIGDNWCYTPAYDGDVANVTIECVDSSGLSCEASFSIEFGINDPPQCNPPADTTIVQCIPGPVSLWLAVTDQDSNLDECVIVSGPGSINRTNWNYTPPTGNDTADVVILCTDDCGDFCEAGFRVIFAINEPPTCESPSDTTIVQCDPEEVSLPVVVYDLDGGTPTCELTDGPGTLADGYWTYTPPGDETVSATITCTDTCGAYTENTFEVIFDSNDPPVCGSMGDTTMLLCSLSEVSLPVTTFDPDDNIVSREVIEGPGSVTNGNWVYTPTGTGTVAVTVRCTDACGESCDETFSATFVLNSAPECQEVNDTTIYMGEPTLISIPVSATDIDGNLIGCTVSDGIGNIVESRWEYTPAASDTVTVSVECIDDCDATCNTEFTVIMLMYECGDINGDFTVDIDDVVHLIGYIFSGGPAPISMEAADVNCSDNVDIDDVVYLVAYIFTGGPAPCADCDN